MADLPDKHLPLTAPLRGKGNQHPAPPKITVIDYDENYFEEKEVKDLEELRPYRDTSTVTWVNVCGLSDPDLLTGIGDLFSLHPLTVQDIQNTDQRPKIEDLVDYIYVAVKMFSTGDGSHGIVTEQVSIVIGRNYVISFKEQDEDIFEGIREKLRKSKGRIRKMGSDYLAYRLLDTIVDGYFLILERLGEELESLEESVVANPRPEVLRAIHALRIEMTVLYRSVWPLREVIGALTRDELPLINKATEIFFRDVYDHTIQIIETMETDRDMISGMLDIYVSSISNRMNEIMKVLTVIATIFIPMTFLAGVWGMNFKYMPEIGWRWSYPVFWLLMIAIAVFMLFYFHRKKWL